MVLVLPAVSKIFTATAVACLATPCNVDITVPIWIFVDPLKAGISSGLLYDYQQHECHVHFCPVDNQVVQMCKLNPFPTASKTSHMHACANTCMLQQLNPYCSSTKVWMSDINTAIIIIIILMRQNARAILLRCARAPLNDY